MSDVNDDFNRAIKQLSPEIYQNMKTAIEVGKWPDGRIATPEQKEHAMRAVIAYERMHNVDPSQRIGFVNVKGSDCHEDDGGVKADNLMQPKPIKWQ
jgi:hypothetical protein